MINAVIIDDQEFGRDALRLVIQTYCPQVNIIGEADGVQSGITLINQSNPDLVFLDIQLQDGTGFDILEKIKSKTNASNPFSFHIIFTTALDQYAIKAFKFSALDYLLKPILSDELIAAVEKVKQNNSNNKLLENLSVLLENKTKNEHSFKKIVLHVGTSLEVHRVDDIIRCESDRGYTYFYFKDNTKVLVSRSLKEFEEMLCTQSFFRIHHSHLINTNYLLKYEKSEGGYVVMTDGFKVPISRNKKDEFSKFLASL